MGQQNLTGTHEGVLLSHERDEMLIHAIPFGRRLGNTMLSERRQTQAVVSCMIPFMYILQNRQIHRESRLIVAGGGGEE